MSGDDDLGAGSFNGFLHPVYLTHWYLVYIQEHRRRLGCSFSWSAATILDGGAADGTKPVERWTRVETKPCCLGEISRVGEAY
jgi:hypothetical protein